MSIRPLDSILYGLTVMAVVVAVWLRVWSRRGIRGPDRIGSEEPLASLAMVMLIGFSLWWVVIPMLLAKIFGSESGGLRFTIGQTLAQLITAAAVLIAGKRIRGADARLIGLDTRPPQIGHGLFTAIVGSCIALPATTWTILATDAVMQRVSPNVDHSHPLIQKLKANPTPGMAVWVTISAVVAAPLVEELLFRAYLQTSLRQFTRRPWLALAATSGIFAAMHQPWSWPAIFVLAMCLGYAYERTGNLWTCILMHAMFNGTELILFRTSG